MKAAVGASLGLLGGLVTGVLGAHLLERMHPQAEPLAAAEAADSSVALELVTATDTLRLSLDSLRAAIAPETLAVRNDPSYGRRSKRYVGFPLDRVLALAGLHPTGDEVVFFQAADGYRATMAEPLAAPGVRGLVAFADADAADGWEPLEKGGTPAPFYLVWASSTGDTASDPAMQRPWPYQLVRIEVIDPREKYDRIYPLGISHEDPIYRGYRAFVVEPQGGDQCIACHTLNGQGGSVAPELNVPRSITEYRDEATLKAFIRDARSFRAQTGMPQFRDHVTEQEASDIVAYLRWLATYKVASAGQS